MPVRSTNVTALVILLLVCTVATAQTGTDHRWALHWYGGKGDSYIYQPVCGPLQTFTGNPKRFDYDNDLFGQPREIKDDVESKRIGEISGFTVYNVIHSVDTGGEPLIMKMIVVQRKRGEFCNIFQQEYQSAAVIATSAYIIEPSDRVGYVSEPLLATTDTVSGSGGFEIQEFWTFDKDGPNPLDLSPFAKAVEDALPSGYSIPGVRYFTRGPDAYGRKFLGNVEALSFDSPACTNWEGNHPAGPCGSVHIEFDVKDHKLVVTRHDFYPAP
jgi:hypothetical protein